MIPESLHLVEGPRLTQKGEEHALQRLCCIGGVAAENLRKAFESHEVVDVDHPAEGALDVDEGAAVAG